jgi:hypothetical protein
VILHEIEPVVEGGCASARRADNLAVVVDPGGDSVRLDASFNPRAFLRENGTITDLNTLIASNPSGLKLLVAESINSSAEIIGLAVTRTGETHGFMATPADRREEDN